MKTLLLVVCLVQATLSLAQKTTAFADSIRKAFGIPELSYAVADAKQVLEIAALGRHSLALRDTATLDDRFHIGSNTKAMTAFIAARYVEKGKLAWNTRLLDVFPEWKQSSKPGYEQVTLQDLLSHRGGVQAFQGPAGFEAGEAEHLPEFKGSRQERRQQFCQYALTLEPVKPDAEQPFVYSNAGVTLAAAMIEKRSGKSWEQLVGEVFNHDLKLKVGFSWPENQKHRDTWGHRADTNRLVPVPSNTPDKIELTEPSGDLNIRLKDYITYIQLNLLGLSGKDAYLKADTYRFLHKGAEHYAMGWYNIYENGKELSTHSGTVGTYYTLVHIDRIRQVAYIIFTNAYNDDTRQGVRLLMRKLKANHGS